jgi:D-alanyl-lipoteichoic acid acyltransferase DltB (MBOAT superfamily)
LTHAEVQEPTRLWSEVGRVAVVSAQLGLIFLVLLTFQLENRAFLGTLALALVGFPLHHFLPARLRMACFALLSLAGIVFVLGPLHACWLVVLGGLLIGLAHLPVRFALRLGLLGLVGVVLVVFRAGWAPSFWPAVIWPVLGSMFMFRLIVYLYDLHHRAAPFGFWRSLAYFFMLPNVCFPLFPVVDYKTFCTTYENRERFAIYQTGLVWISRGLVHLLLYRFVYQEMVIDPEEVADAGDLVRYVLATFLLYLRVSGAFHVAIGLLHLFGFNLPETHHRYLLAPNFADLWRRFNIYWRDFMMKLVFYPLLFGLKGRLSRTGSLVLATSAAFVVTWLLHSYQWFWLRGSFPVTWQDAIFWSVLGALVLAKTLWDTKHRSRRSLERPKLTLASALKRAASTVFVFTTMCLLWSVWSADSLGEWTLMLSRGTEVSGRDAGLILAGMALLGLAGVLFGSSSAERTEAAGKSTTRAEPFPFWRSAATTTALCGVLLALGWNPLLLGFAPALAETVDRLRTPRLNQQDANTLERGYYEDLTDVSRFSPELSRLYAKREGMWTRLDQTQGVRQVDDILSLELPASAGFSLKGASVTTNRWGMRDREYERVPAADTYRIVLVGASVSMGSGVEDHQTFENVLEDRLNREKPEGGPRHYEILNLSIGGLGPLQKLRMFEQKGLDFAPQALFYIAHSRDPWKAAKDLTDAVVAGVPVPWDFPAEIAAGAGVFPGSGRKVAQSRMLPHADELLGWAYATMVDRCRERGVEPYLIYTPRTRDGISPDDVRERIIGLASAAGFTVLDVSRAYENVRDPSTLYIRVWDWHPNPEGHRLIADELYRQFVPRLPGPDAPQEEE